MTGITKVESGLNLKAMNERKDGCHVNMNQNE